MLYPNLISLYTAESVDAVDVAEAREHAIAAPIKRVDAAHRRAGDVLAAKLSRLPEIEACNVALEWQNLAVKELVG